MRLFIEALLASSALGPPVKLATINPARKARIVLAAKLACLFYRLLKHGQQYVDKGMAYYGAKYREQQIRSLTRRAQKLGLQFTSSQSA